MLEPDGSIFRTVAAVVAVPGVVFVMTKSCFRPSAILLLGLMVAKLLPVLLVLEMLEGALLPIGIRWPAPVIFVMLTLSEREDLPVLPPVVVVAAVGELVELGVMVAFDVGFWLVRTLDADVVGDANMPIGCAPPGLVLVVVSR